MHKHSEHLPREIDTGLWGDGHLQGIALDPIKGYIYYSFTTVIVKARLSDGSIIGWAGGLFGHLGCIDFNEENGMVYGALEYKHDSIGRGIIKRLGVCTADEDAFYIAIFDVDRIDRPSMDATDDKIMKTVYVPEVSDWYHGKCTSETQHSFRVCGIDGIGIGPVFGEEENSETRLMLCSGIHLDPENNSDIEYQIILQYDWRELDKISAPLCQQKPHHTGVRCEAHYFLDIANTRWCIQNLEYDAYDRSWIACVYPGKREGSPNLPMYIIDGTAAPQKKDNPYDSEVLHLSLKQAGIYHEQTKIWGYSFHKGQEGVFAFGDGSYYFAHPYRDTEHRYGAMLRLYRRSFDSNEPFVTVEN